MLIVMHAARAATQKAPLELRLPVDPEGGSEHCPPGVVGDERRDPAAEQALDRRSSPLSSMFYVTPACARCLRKLDVEVLHQA